MSENDTQYLQTYLEDKISKSRKALAALEPYTQEQVDALVKACAKVVFDNAEELARDAVAETQMGVVEDKILKNKNKARLIWWSLKDKKSVGIIEREQHTGIVKIAKPVGVVAAITPVTNPNVTPMSNSMFALKGRNPIIIAPHPKALKCGIRTVELMNRELKKLGAPENVIQILDIPSMELTQMLTHKADVVVATGGMGMVRSVYSSGKPALGVGAGNVQCIIDRGIDYESATKMVTKGRSFDNGIICSGEQSAIMPRAEFDTIIDEFAKNGTFLVPTSKRDDLREKVFPGGEMNREFIGQSAKTIAAAIGMEVPSDTKALLVEADGKDDRFGAEKMFPVIAAYRYDTWDEAVTIAKTNLDIIGKGHSVCIHSNNKERVEQAALKLDVSRIVVNQISAFAAGGSYQNGLSPTNTLGCGSWGNNSISENLTYYHLINISRIGNVLHDRTAPPDDRIWE